ncbi:hypothetical protein KAX97_10395 [candidate division WOR-3 bacterium]|nr:hypothetical protein [candidate division WOR-3 bacterium]
MFAYILVFDRWQIGVSMNKLHETIKNSPNIKTWWHYLKHCYIIISDSDVVELSTEIREIIPKKGFLLMSVNLDQSDGWLPKKAWDWIKRNEK